MVGPVYQTLKLVLLEPPGMSFHFCIAISLTMLCTVVLQRKMLHLVSYIHNTLVAENVPKGGLGGRSCVSDTQAGFTGTARYEFQVKHCRFLAIVGR